MNAVHSNPPISNPDRLAYWYFRLNGFLTIENFIVHPDTGDGQRTDADLLAVRFRHRAENLVCPMEDDPRLACCDLFVNVVIAEVKTGSCALNGPWTDPGKKNMHRVLSSTGCIANDLLDLACKCLYKQGKWASELVQVRLFALGNKKSPNLAIGEEQPKSCDWRRTASDMVRGHRILGASLSRLRTPEVVCGSVGSGWC
jgi:hypothetical protein